MFYNIMATIEIDLDDYIDELETSDLIYELKARFNRAKKYEGKHKVVLETFLNEVLSELDSDDILKHLSNCNRLSLTQGMKLKEFLNNEL